MSSKPTATIERPSVQTAEPTVKTDQEGTTVTAEQTVSETPAPAATSAPAIVRAADACHSVTVVKGSKKWTFDFFQETGATQGAADDVVKRWADAMAKNDWAAALLALAKIDGPASFFIPAIPATKTDRRKVSSVQLNNAYKTLAAAGKIEGAYLFVAATVKATKQDAGGTRLFKMR